MRRLVPLVLLLSTLCADAGAQAAADAPLAPATARAGAAEANMLPASPWTHSSPALEPWGGSDGSVSMLQRRPPTYWLNGGIGVSRRGAAGIVGGSYQFGGNLLSARGAGTVAVFGDELWDLGLLYGRATRPGVVHLSLAAGVGIVGGVRPAGGSIFDPQERIPTTVTLPIELQLFFRPTGILGVGVYGFASLNEEESFGGAAAAVQIGRLR
jgi:hypothetical protein